MSSGKQILGTIVGAAVGFIVGGPTGALYGASVGFGATMEMPDFSGPRLDELRVQKSSYGDGIKILYGKSRISGSLIWMSDVDEEKRTEGGKGGGGETTSYSYSASVAIAICEGQVLELSKIWADTNLIYDASNGGSDSDYYVADENASVGVSKTIVRLFKGTEAQPACGFLRSIDSTQPAYRGLAYVVIEDLDLSPFGNRVPNFSFLMNGKSVKDPVYSQNDRYEYARRGEWGSP